jgi:hypothetical protein
VESVAAPLIAWCLNVVRQWQRFWFLPAAPHTLALIRILAGGMLFYTHLVWGLQIEAFLGPHAWVPKELAREINPPTAWSYLYYIDSPALLWPLHLLALAVFAMLTVGLFTRVTSILACIITLSYCHRLVGLQFGLDQVNALLVTYLAVGPSGAVYSVDRWLKQRKSGEPLPVVPSTAANVAIRLIQVHMCIVYLFGGISKMQGTTWWNGSAVWYAVANHEYQSIDMTWLVHFPFVVALMTHATVFWETFYCVLIWPKQTRPLFLAMAVAVHGGIALFLGMITFGLAMIIANLAFVPPELVAACVNAVSQRIRRMLQPGTTTNLSFAASRVDGFDRAFG